MFHTGGRGTEPVIAVYCLKISLGVGPIKKNPSKIPASNIQCVATSGISSLFVFDLVNVCPLDEIKSYEKEENAECISKLLNVPLINH